MAFDIRKIVTDKIIDGLENGQIPWAKPWKDGGAVNHSTGKRYRGLNQLILSFVASQEGLINRWVTFKGIVTLGGRLKKGEKGIAISYFNFIENEETETTRGILRYYTVFSISQMEVVPSYDVIEKTEIEKIDTAEKIVVGMQNSPKINFYGESAYYSPKIDTVVIPEIEKFNTSEGYYATVFHELGHSTGHESRLSRKGITEHTGKYEYAIEELVAEMTSAFLCGECQIERTIENSTAYIQSWLKVLKNNRQLLLTAGGQAQKATDYILGENVIY